MRTGDTKCFGCNMAYLNCYQTCPNSPARNNAVAHIINHVESITEPTRRCLICESLENPKVEIISESRVWLCDKCRAALLKVVESEGEE